MKASTLPLCRVCGGSHGGDPLDCAFRVIKELELAVARRGRLLRLATLDEMGGEPDLFWPEPSWEKWNQEVRKELGDEG